MVTKAIDKAAYISCNRQPGGKFKFGDNMLKWSQGLVELQTLGFRNQPWTTKRFELTEVLYYQSAMRKHMLEDALTITRWIIWNA